MSARANRGARLITLGTLAGPIPRANRAQSSNLVIVNGAFYVIDAGDGVARRLSKAGIPIRDIGTIFLTHHHDDHTAGLGTLMCAAWNQNRRSPINVYGPQGTARLVEAAIQYFSVSSAIRMADGGRIAPLEHLFFGHDVGIGNIYRDENIRVTAVENSHFDFHRSATAGGKPISYAYRFETPDRVIVFTGDTGPSQAVVALAKRADLLVAEANSVDDRLEAMIQDGRWQSMDEQQRSGIIGQAMQGHLTPNAVGELASCAEVGSVVLTHLSYRPPPNTNKYTSWAAAVRKHFSGPVFIAEDLMEF